MSCLNAPNSSILREAGLETRILIGDEDSSPYTTVRRGTLKLIFKLSDRNHLEKSSVKDLYKLKIELI